MYAVVKPEIDVEKLARALIQIAVDMQKKEDAAKSDGHRGLFQDAADLEDRAA